MQGHVNAGQLDCALVCRLCNLRLRLPQRGSVNRIAVRIAEHAQLHQDGMAAVPRSLPEDTLMQTDWKLGTH